MVQGAFGQGFGGRPTILRSICLSGEPLLTPMRIGTPLRRIGDKFDLVVAADVAGFMRFYRRRLPPKYGKPRAEMDVRNNRHFIPASYIYKSRGPTPSGTVTRTMSAGLLERGLRERSLYVRCARVGHRLHADRRPRRRLQPDPHGSGHSSQSFLCSLRETRCFRAKYFVNSFIMSL